MNRLRLFFIAVALVATTSNLTAQKPLHFEKKVGLVNPFVGTDGHGHTYPGAVAPFGMVQLSPDSRLEGWDGCSGYHYSDTIIYGFSHTHLSGTGCSDYGDILLMPTSENKFEKNKQYFSSFSHKNEEAQPGYYKVKLNSGNITVELAATERGGYHRYTFPKGEQRNVILNLQHLDFCIGSVYKPLDKYTIVGMRRSKAWNEDQVVYFAVRFSEPIVETDLIPSTGNGVIAVLSFGKENNNLEAVLSLSSVSEEGALKNLGAETCKNFNEAKELSTKLWEKELGKIDIEGGTLSEQRTFYTALYHSMITPNLYSDVDNQYLGMDKKIHKADNYNRYTVFSLWDTYRTLHPLLTIIDQKRTKDFVNTALDIYKQNGILPVWELASFETNCMIGMHGISMIADAYMKGICGDKELTLEAMVNNANSTKRIENLRKFGIEEPNLYGLDAFDKYGYISSEMEHESVSKTLEYAYNMWCVAQVAKEQGKMDVYKEYIQKAQYYKNLFNPNNKFIQPKENGRFLPNFDPKQIDQNYTEGNGWHYGFYVPQDIEGLKTLMGGDKVMADLLDTCFNSKEKTTGRNQADVTGLIGQYAQGNEPSHHAAYLFDYVGQAWKTQETVHKILTTLFSDKPDGICGNDDCGQMSAWYIMSALGFYPVCPSSNEYAIGSPLFTKATLHLENGKSFVINSPRNETYIQSLKLNGKDYNNTFLNHKDIMEGGVLDFTMGSTPNKSFGAEIKSRPHSSINDNLINIVPYFEYEGNNTFDKTKDITAYPVNKNDKVSYVWNNINKEKLNIKDKKNKKNDNTITLEVDGSLVITAISKDKNKESKPATCSLFKIPQGRKVQLLSKYDPQYTGGGAEGLIDLIRGSNKWRLGSWQGYNGCNFTAIVDLGKKQEVKRIGGNFIQETSPWIFMPTKVNYYVSDNGVDFTLFETVLNPIDEKDTGVKTHTFFTIKPLNARYVKVEAINRGVNPPWHISAGEKTWLFIDEIVIEQ